MNISPIVRAATLMGPTLAVKPCRVVIPLSFEAMSSDNSELTLFFFFLNKVFVFVMVDRLEKYNLLYLLIPMWNQANFYILDT